MLLPLVNNQKAWEALQNHLSELIQRMTQQLVVETSELELRRLQGKLDLLARLLTMKEACLATMSNKEIKEEHGKIQ
jgi:hypothetical protein